MEVVISGYGNNGTIGVSVNEIGGCSVSVQAVSKEADKAIQKIPKKLSKISKSIKGLSECITRSNKEIADNILNSANTISNSFSQIANELERKNKLDEYYMLQDKILEFEEKLIKFGVLEQAYENMQIEPTQIIYFSEDDARIIVNIFEEQPEEYEKFKIFISQSHKNPVEVIKTWIMDNYVELYIAGYTKNGERKVALRIKGTNINLIKRLETKNIGYNLMGKLLSQRYCLIPNEDFVKRIFNELQSFSQVEETYKIYDLISFISSVNRDIVLDNLRNLYSGLRNEVRRYRMQI